MPVTRNDPRIERNAFLGHLFRALMVGLVVMGILAVEFDLRRLIIELTGSPTLRGYGIVPTVALLVGIVATAFLAAALRRLARWLIALEHVRMLKEPRRAALVPPLPSHLRSLAPKPWRKVWQGLGYLLAASAFMGMLVLLQYVPSDSPPEDPEAEFGSWVMAVLFLVGSVYGLADAVLRWRRMRRAERASRTGGRVSDLPAQAERASNIPKLTVAFEIPRTRARTELPVTAERNVFGGPPWNIAYLRLFDNEEGLQRFLKGSWRQCGYVHFIRDADSVGRDELRSLQDGARLFLDSRAVLLADLEKHPAEPLPIGERVFERLAEESVAVDDRYGSYPVYAPLCRDHFWKEALDVLLDRADVVVLDLSGYHWQNLGTGYELQRVVDRFPIERCVFLTDPNTDRPFVEAQIQRAWSQMASGSPNAGDAPRQVVVSDSTSVATRAMLQERVEHLPSYAARVSRLSPEGAAEQASLETARTQRRAEARKPVSALRVLLRLWGLTR